MGTTAPSKRSTYTTASSSKKNTPTMTGPTQSSNAPSLRTTRSRANPTVTLYSLDTQSVPVQVRGAVTETSEQGPKMKEESAVAQEPVKQSRFFAGDTSGTKQGPSQSNDAGKRSRPNVDSSQHAKRQKVGLVNDGQPALTSPTSTTSTLSPPPRIGSVVHPNAVMVKPEPPATPLRRPTRSRTGPCKDAEKESTPLRTVKAEEATSVRKTPKIKKEGPTPRPSTPIKLKLDKPHPEPPRWRRQYELIEKMREKIVAPVDTLGCETPNGERTNDPKTIRLHMLISLMLSSQTKDPVTSQAVTNLHNTLPGGLTAASLAAAPSEVVAECINKVGFWRRKTEYIQDAARRILEGGLDDGEVKNEVVEGISEVEGDIPRTLGGLVKLKGVGPKMAFLALQCAWNINAGVGVDVHVHRITNRLGWHKPKTTEPEQTRLNLESWLPPHLFKPINHVLVGFGQVVCLPVGPRCDVCFLGTERICPSRVANVNVKGRKVVEFGFIAPGSVDETPVKEEKLPVPRGYWHAAAGNSPIIQKIEIEIGTDVLPEVPGAAQVSAVKQETEEGLDDVAQAIQDPGFQNAEQVVDMTMAELAIEQGRNVQVIKAE